ncbi:glycosyltransferase family 39 protein [Sphingomicrobium sediminis]|uniref:Glycosyltransferase family 39 protein n=1 Tax=Sphingomicrobium sediminis TaxID=2950949 RepID=A0A9X2J2I6_9SPHN|nr:glycosyltransferase family 39 protein [Sphingomicrobium sediminis]MCM8557065.1 glycosyltransferase family 39 protein [Sphingomicrobium sediminis]
MNAGATREKGWAGRPAWMWLAAITLLGAIVRSVMLGHHALWGDEALSLIIARLPLEDLFIRPLDPSPGLYYLVQKLWLPLGEAPWIVRFPSFLFGVATIPAAFWLGKNLDGVKTGLIFAAFVAVFPDLVDYAQEARAYALLVLLEVLALAALASAFPREGSPRPRRLILAAILAIMAVYTHPTAWFVMAPAGLVALYFGWKARIMPPLAAVSLLAGGLLLVIPEIQRSIAYSQVGHFNWLQQPGAFDFLRLLSRLVIPIPIDVTTDMPGLAGWFGAQGIVALLLASQVAALAWLVLARIRVGRTEGVEAPRQLAMAMFAVLALVFPLLIYLAGIITPMVMGRTMLPFTVGIALGLALLVRRLPGKRWGIAAFVFIAAELVLFSPARSKPDWRDVVQVVDGLDPADGVIICADWNAASYLFAHREAELKDRAIFTMVGGAPMTIVGPGENVANGANGFRDRVWIGRVDPARSLQETDRFDPNALNDVAIVQYLCEPAQQALLDEWFDPARTQDVKRYSQGPDYSPTTIERFTL